MKTLKILLVICFIFCPIFSQGVSYNQEFQVNTSVEGFQDYPSISSLSDSKFAVCWTSNGQDGSLTGVFCQLFSNSGGKVGDEFQVNTYINDRQQSPIVVNLPGDKFFICWSSRYQDGSDYGIYSQFYNNLGVKLGSEFRVNKYTKGAQLWQSAASLVNNKFIICWTSGDQDGSSWGVYCQLYNSSGQMTGNEFRVNSYKKDGQFAPTVSSLYDGKFVICWTSGGKDDSDEGIYGKYYLTDSIIHPLSSFQLIQPQYDISVKATNPIFKWEQGSEIHINFPWELTYDLYIDTTENFTVPVIIEAIQDTIYKIDSLAAGQTYFWKVLAKNIIGDSLWSSSTNGFFISHDATNIGENIKAVQPNQFTLEQNYPNPFNESTIINYRLPVSSQVKLSIYNLLGQEVESLVNGHQSAGEHQINWNAEGQASGVYIINAQIISEYGKSYCLSRKILLLR